MKFRDEPDPVLDDCEFCREPFAQDSAVDEDFCSTWCRDHNELVEAAYAGLNEQEATP